MDQRALAADNVETKMLVEELANPSGLAVQPETGHVFIASRYGVYRYDPAGHKAHVEIGGYPEPTDVYGKGPKYEVGPLGLAFLDNGHLVVGDGSRKDGEELVRVYKVGAAPLPPTGYLQEDAAVHTLGPITQSEQTASGEGNFYAVAVGAGRIFVTCNGDDTKGWIAKSDVADGKPSPLELFIATKVATNVDAPVPLTFTPDGSDLVVGQMGEINIPKDSLLTTYDPGSGSLKQKWTTGLYDITGVAYNPKSGKLYATDFAWMATQEGGLFRLDIEGDTVTAVKITSLDKPTALAFDEDGNLYLTTFGTAEEGSDKPPGGLYVIDAEDLEG